MIEARVFLLTIQLNSCILRKEGTMHFERYICVFYETPGGKFPVEVFISSLTLDAQDKFLYKKELLEYFGPGLRYPHTKGIGGGIFELRFKGKEGQIRVLFFFCHKRRIILVYGFCKKTQKTPRKEIKIAAERMNEYIKRSPK